MRLPGCCAGGPTGDSRRPSARCTVSSHVHLILTVMADGGIYEVAPGCLKAVSATLAAFYEVWRRRVTGGRCT
jgi:hypothetical protein